MLPFTKRPGRDESGDNDVVTKDDLVSPASVPPTSKRSVPPGASGAGRGKFASVNDEEMTTLMPTKSLGDAIASRPSVRPAAGSPAIPSSRPATVPPSARSSGSAGRSGKFAAMEEDEDGRTVVRGAPKIVKRNTAAPNSSAGNKMGMPTAPTTISPAAVIKATLESARAGVKPRTDNHLMAGPPQDLLEDLADRHLDVGAEHTAIIKSSSVAPSGMVQGVKALSTQLLQPQSVPYPAGGSIPPGSSRALSSPPSSGANQSGGYAAQSGGYAAQYNGPVPSGSVSVPGVSMPPSMPAHFMMAQAPYSDGRIDPPGTAVTSRTKIGGRPAMSWALALAAFGLFVGVGAVAVMNGNEGFKDASASFVDPSRAAGGKAAAAAPGAPAAPTPVAVANEPPTTVGVPPVAVPPAPPGAAAPAAPEAVAAPVVTTPAAPPPAAAAPAAPTAVAAATPAPATPAPARVAAAPAAPRPAPAPAPRAPKPAPQPASDETTAAAPAPKPAKGGKGAAKGGEMDDETKKALDELQKAQLERSF